MSKFGCGVKSLGLCFARKQNSGRKVASVSMTQRDFGQMLWRGWVHKALRQETLAEAAHLS